MNKVTSTNLSHPFCDIYTHLALELGVGDIIVLCSPLEIAADRSLANMNMVARDSATNNRAIEQLCRNRRTL
jgi:hypothetical protein